MARCILPCCARIALVGAVLGLPATSLGATIYVDTSLPADCPASYDPASRACGGGTDVAFASLDAGASAAQPGDEVVVRAATFGTQFVPGVSGTANAPIVLRAASGETVTFTGINDEFSAIRVVGRSYLVLEGFTVTQVGGWLRIEDSDHITVRANAFSVATIEGTKGSLKLLRATDCVIDGNSFDDGNDNITVVDSSRNLVVNNHVTKGRHSLLSVRCSNDNVFRGNTFQNPDQKAAEIYDCEGSSSDDPVKLDATKRNLFEWNRFAGTASSDVSYDYNGIQFAGQDGIVRRNLFYQNLGGGLGVQVYSDEALANHGNRIVHNTFYANRCWALSVSNDTGAGYYDNLVESNLFYDNADCAGGGEQILTGNPNATVLTGNTLADQDPGFVDAAGADFHLTEASSVLDTAPFLTTAVGDGSGTELAVADARFFFSGGGIEGESGDVVQLAGGTETARVTAVDRDTNTLTLDAALSWSAGQGVSFAYAGTAPDPGAYERGLPDPPPNGGSGGAAGTGGAGTGGGGAAGASSGAGGLGGGAAANSESDSGCACSSRPAGSRAGAWAALLFGALSLRVSARRRRQRFSDVNEPR